MGLDIYLYTATQAAQNKAYDEASNALYEEGPDGKSPRDLMTDDQHKAWSAQYSYTSNEDVASVNYPDHLFNRRYLRSSYNAGGFNHTVPALLGTNGEVEYPSARGSLYWIFEPMGREWDGDDGIVATGDLPKLRESRDRARWVIEALASSDRLRTTTVSPNMFSSKPQTKDHAALAMYRTHIAERAGRDLGVDDWYSTNGGNLEVFGTGLSVLAAVPGMDTFTPGVHLIYRMQDEGFNSYVESAHIVVEFCDEAIMLIERDGAACISWSG